MKETLEGAKTPLRTLVVTYREYTLMNALEGILPKAKVLLCLWHVRKNVMKNCKKYFPKDNVPGALEAFHRFMQPGKACFTLLSNRITKSASATFASIRRPPVLHITRVYG